MELPLTYIEKRNSQLTRVRHFGVEFMCAKLQMDSLRLYFKVINAYDKSMALFSMSNNGKYERTSTTDEIHLRCELLNKSYALIRY